jgi:serine/threonine protein phosphatase PrpC
MMQQALPFDFVLSFCREMIPGKGEDSSCHSFCDSAGLIGVFDGCGGAGARTHDFYSGRTEAYMASRLCAGAFYDQFRATFPCGLPAEKVAQELFAPAALERLKTYSPPKDPDAFVMKGSMVRTLPTTAAAALIQSAAAGVAVSPIWAGDSRVYVLDGQGLAQLTVDDTSVPDPMENVYEDGVLRNILCSDRKVTLHSFTQVLQPPFVVLAATDGCFGYVSTPMEFEGMLLETLLTSQSPAQWEQRLADMIGSVAGDDHAMVMASFGYGDFAALQNSLRQRWLWLRENYILPVQKLPLEDRQSRFALWDSYRGNYFRLLKDGAE